MKNNPCIYYLMIAALCLSAALTGCDSGSLGPRKFKSWIEDEKNGLKRSVEQNGYRFMLQYKPVEYVVVMEEQKDRITKAVLNQRKEELGGMVYFNLSILNPEGKSAFAENTVPGDPDYHQFNIQQDFYLVSANDTLPCLMYHYENHGGISPDVMLLGFENREKLSESGFSFIYADRVLNCGIVKTDYDKNTILNIPKLKTK